jgi:hypothetical protein
LLVPVLIVAASERARLRFIDFFTAHIHNPHTCAAFCVQDAIVQFRNFADLGLLALMGGIGKDAFSTKVTAKVMVGTGALKPRLRRGG